MGMTFPQRARLAWRTLTRADPLISLDQWANYFKYGNNLYTYVLNQTIPGEPVEKADGSWGGYVQLFRGNPVIFACLDRRQKLFSEARFQFREVVKGRPGDLFGGGDNRSPAHRELEILNHPWPNATTGNLLTRAIIDADLAGNFYALRTPDRHIHRLRPDYVHIVLGQRTHASLPEVLGYLYHPKGPTGGVDPVVLEIEEVAHFAPVPDPAASFRGMSWLTPIIREVWADDAATTHKGKFFENGATPNMVVKTGQDTREKFELFKDLFLSGHRGVEKAYETVFLAEGGDAIPVGSTFQQMDFKVTQGAGETRIAAAAGVPPIIVGLSEGLAAATYSNYGQARRAFADLTIRPMWRDFANAMSSIIRVPQGAELWYDDRDIPFLAEDVKDAAEVQTSNASAIRTLLESGFEPDAVIDAVTAGDLERLRGEHSGYMSVQLQPPAPETPKTELVVPTNGQVTEPALAEA